MENDIRVIKAIIASRPQPMPLAAARLNTSYGEAKENMTYAAVAAKMQQRDITKQQREKTEVTISLETIKENTVAIQLQTLDEARRTEILQEFINDAITKPSSPGSRKGSPIKITRTVRVSKWLIKIICQNPEDAETIRQLKWPQILGATIANTTVGVVFHGVAKEDLDPRAEGFNMQEAIKQFEEANAPVKVAHLGTLIRNP